MTIQQNLEMKRFMVWARALAEHLVFRRIWVPMRVLAGLTQSTVVSSIMNWFDGCAHPAAARITAVANRVRRQPSAIPEFLKALYSEPELDELFTTWWNETVVPMLPRRHVAVLTEIFRFDLLSRPVFDPPDLLGGPSRGLPTVDVEGEAYYLRPDAHFDHDIPAVLAAADREEVYDAGPRPTTLSIYLKVGFHAHYGNHEQGVYFSGRTEAELRHLGVLNGSTPASVSGIR
jgi:radical SAM C-methyltransferase